MNTYAPESEFSHLLAVDKIPANGLVRTLEADPAARKRLMLRFDLLDLSKLHADLTVEFARAGQAVRVRGHVAADVVQKCGVTNDPVPDHIESDIDVLYTSDREEEGTQNFVDPAEAEVESLENGVIDLGELVVQNFGVALNPYPRKAGAVFETIADKREEVAVSALAQLVELAKKEKDKDKSKG